MKKALHQWLTAQAQRRPEATAVALNERGLTYGALESLANRLARTLGEHGCRPGDRVALLMPKSPLAIAALLGIYKAGAIYVPLDTASPPPRLAKVLAKCEANWLLADQAVDAVLAELGRQTDNRLAPRVGRLDDAPSDAAAFGIDEVLHADDRLPLVPCGGDDVAHILFTSGSTGDPKGVPITHANVIHFVEWAVRYFGIDASDRLSGHAPLPFDLSFFDIFGSIAAGAELHLVPAETQVFPNQLADWIRATGLTQWFSVPSVLNYMASFDAVRNNDFPRLRRLLWCGEVLPTRTLMYWMARLPRVRFTNLYGPTEATIASSYYTVPRRPRGDREAIPIGRPCDGESLRVLDEQGQPLPPGQVGEICIGGVGLSAGYWRDPDKTAAAFITTADGERLYRTGDLGRVDDEGLVHFLGRADSQIKSRGYRIELGEIEAAVSALDCLRECAVVALPGEGFDGAVIHCAYVPIADARVTPAALRRELEQVLPRYMLPARWTHFGELPKNANGKTDRRRLRELLQRHAVAADQQA